MGLQRAIRRVFAGALTLGMATAAAATGGVPPAGQLSMPGGPPARMNLARVLDSPAFPHSRIAPRRRTAGGPARTVGGGAATVSGGDLFDEIYRRAAPVEKTLTTVSAAFVETTTSTLLKTPQVARGTLVGRRPHQVRLVYTGADARTMIVNGNTLALDWPSRNLEETRDVSGTMHRAERFFLMSTPAELRTHFDIVATEAPERAGSWHVIFTPKRKQMREGVSRVHLWIDQGSLVLQALKMEYPGGDSRLMEFSDVRLNPPVAADAFATAGRR